MKVFAGMDPRLALREVGAYARRVEAMGYDGLQISETIHDSLAVALLAAEHTTTVKIRTAVTLAFPRSPTLLAYAAWDLASFSDGRFELGLGTQIRENIEDRYGVTWTEPVSRMRDYLTGLAALFRSFREGADLGFVGENFRLTRMQPFFNPGPDPSTSVPPIWLGGVNAAICQLAGELASGFIAHPTSSNRRYLKAVCLPNLREGALRAHRDVGEIEVVITPPLIVGRTQADLDRQRVHQRQTLAFLYSTPAYRRTLVLYGWPELDGRLRALVRERQWARLPALVTDEMLDALVPTGTYAEIAAIVIERYSDLVNGLVLPPPADPADDAHVAEVVRTIQESRRS